MAVVCACIPSLRPLSKILARGVFKHSLHSISHTSSQSRWGSSKVKTSNGTFSQLEQAEDLRPLGHNTTIRSGRNISGGEDDGTAEMPKSGINVRTDITWTNSDRLVYDDRLY